MPYSLAPSTTWIVSKYGVFSGPYFPVFGLNTEIYSVKFRIKSAYRKIRTEKNTYLHTFHTVKSCGKSQLILDLTEKEYNKHDYIIIICPTLRWNKTYHTKGWIRHNGNVWLIEPKDKLYQWIESLLLLLVRKLSNTIYHRLYHRWWKPWQAKTIRIRTGIRTIIYGCFSLIQPYTKS